MHEFRQPGPAADEKTPESLFFHVVEGHGLADDHVPFKHDAQLFQVGDLRPDDAFRQTKLGNAVAQDPGKLVQGLEDRHLVAALRHFPGKRQTGGPGTDGRHLHVIFFLDRGNGNAPAQAFAVRGEPFQVADGHRRLFHFVIDALGLALDLLRADAAAYGGQGVGFL